MENMDKIASVLHYFLPNGQVSLDRRYPVALTF